jgi:hypothetical protein
MSADSDARTLSAVNQHCSIPTDVLADATFDRFITRKFWFMFW